MSGKEVFVSEFLNERKDRFKPDEANKTGLYRLEKIDFSGKIYISENKPTKTNMILVKKGDLVISGINVEKGALSVYEGDNDILATIHYSSYEYDKTKIDIEYLKWFLKSPNFQSLLLEQNGGGIKTEMKAKTFLKLKVFLPTLEEQKDILKIIQGQEKEILELEKIGNKNLSYIKQLKQAILQEAIEGKLTKTWRENNPNIESSSVLLEKIQKEKEELVKQKKLKKQEKLKEISQDEIPFEIPENWSWCRLGEVYTYIQRGPSAKYSENSSVGIINQKCIRWDKIEYSFIKYYDKSLIEKLSEERFIIKGDILMNSTGTGTIGRCYLVKNIDEKKYIADSHVTILRELTNFVDNGYITLFLSSDIIQDYINNGGIGGATNQIELSKSILENFIIPLPPLEEQKEIVKKVDELMKFCLSLEKQSLETKENSENLMKSVLSEVFSK